MRSAKEKLVEALRVKLTQFLGTPVEEVTGSDGSVALRLDTYEAIRASKGTADAFRGAIRDTLREHSKELTPDIDVEVTRSMVDPSRLEVVIRSDEWLQTGDNDERDHKEDLEQAARDVIGTMTSKLTPSEEEVSAMLATGESPVPERSDPVQGVLPGVEPPPPKTEEPTKALEEEEAVELVQVPEDMMRKVWALRLWHSLGHSESCMHRGCLELRRELAEKEVLGLVHLQPMRYGVVIGPERFTPQGLDLEGARCMHKLPVFGHCHHCEYMWQSGVNPVIVEKVDRSKKTDEDPDHK